MKNIYLLLILFGFFAKPVHSQQVVSCSPFTPAQGQTFQVTLTGVGTHFKQGSGTSTVAFGSSPSTIAFNATSFSATNDTSLNVLFTIPPTAPANTYSIYVTDWVDGQIQQTTTFNLNAKPVPGNINASPNSAVQAQTLAVTITGSHTFFKQASATAHFFFSQGTTTINAYSFVPNSDSSVTAQFAIPYNAPLGIWDVNISDAADGTVTGKYRFTINQNGSGCSALFSVAAAPSSPGDYIVTNQATGRGPLHYLWNWGDNTTDSIATPTHTYSGPSVYLICLNILDSVGCRAAYCDTMSAMRLPVWVTANHTKVTVVLPSNTGIDEQHASGRCSIWPNPSSENIRIQYSGTGSSGISLNLADLSGRIILQQKISALSGTTDNTFDLDVSNLSGGTYLLRLTTADDILIRKIIIQH